MTPATEMAALVTLLRSGRHPRRHYAALVEDAGSALAVLRSELDQHGAQPSLFGDGPTPAASLDGVDAEIEAWKAEGMQPLSVLDPGYPENLLAVHDRPALIFVAGALMPQDTRSLAVVGARTPSGRGLACAAAIAKHLVERDYTVASGLATGIDTAAHAATLAHGGRTIAVIGTGLRRFYPPQNAALQRRIAAEGAVISQFWPDAPPSKRSFPMRNAVMSGVTLATIVVEASPTSGSRLQARLALAHGRPVFLLRALLAQQWARELADRPGTHVVDAPEEITNTVERLTSPDALVA